MNVANFYSMYFKTASQKSQEMTDTTINTYNEYF